MLIDFRQFLYDSVEKFLFKTVLLLLLLLLFYYFILFIFFLFFHDRNAKADTSTQSEYTAYIICSRTECHSAMHNNLNILEMKQVLELQPFIPNANRLNI